MTTARCALPRRTLAAVVVAAVVLHLLLAIAAWWPEPRRLVGDEKLYLTFAEQPFDGRLVTVPEPWPPLWPHLLRPVLAVGGRVAVTGLQTLLLVAAIAGLAVLARRALGAVVVMPLLALALLDPQLAACAGYLWPEMAHLALGVAVALVLSRPTGTAPGSSFVAGLLGAIAGSIKSLFAPLLPLLAVIAGWRGSPRRRALCAALALAGLALPLLPFAVEQGILASSGGAGARFNLLVALREDGRRSIARPDPAAATYREMSAAADPSRWVAEALEAEWARTDLLAELGDRLARHPFRVLEWRTYLVEQLPGGRLHTPRQGYVETPRWLSASLSGWSALHLALLLSLTGLGLTCARWTSRAAAVAVACIGGWQVAVLLAVHAVSRYRVQLEPVLLLLAAAGWAALREGRVRGARGWAGTAFAAILLFCGFGGPVLDSLGW